MLEILDAVVTTGIDFTNVAAAGPPSDLPAPVPDFVSDVLGAVRSFVDGAVDKLGGVVSGLTPGGN